MLLAIVTSGVALCPATGVLPLRLGASLRPRSMTHASLPEVDSYATTDSGLKAIDVKRGSGEVAESGRVVTIRYSGELLSRATRSVGVGVPKEPWQVVGRQETFIIGGGRSPMWEEAVSGMRSGGQRRILVPPSAVLRPLKKGKVVSVPEGDTVAFDCELCRVETGALALAVRLGLWGQGSLAPALGFLFMVNLGCYLWYGSIMLTEPATAMAPPYTAGTATVAAIQPSVASTCSAKRLLASREQLDLAVQASSVQAWTDAAEVAADPLLDGKLVRDTAIRTHAAENRRSAAWACGLALANRSRIPPCAASRLTRRLFRPAG